MCIMKKLIFTCLIMLIASSFAMTQTTITVSGTVTNSANNALIPNHPVTIYAVDSMTSFFFNQTVNTNSNGSYSVVIQNYPSSAYLSVRTQDCNNNWQYQYPSVNTSYVANFSICVGNPTTCQAAFTAYPDSNNQFLVHFNDLSNGNPTSWLWDFGDTTTSTLQNPSHVYAQNGLYWITLTIVCSNTQYSHTDSVYIGSSGCQADFTFIPDSLYPTTINFFDQSTSNPAIYTWNFGDNSTSSSQNPTHTYAQIGTYNVSLTIWGSGCQSTIVKTVTIASTPVHGTIYGQVFAGNDTTDFGLVYLIDFNPITNILTAIDTTALNNIGRFHFYNIPYGSYYVKAALSPNSIYYSSYLPTYYGNQLLWSNATTITLNSTTAVANISLIAGNNPGGPGFIGGNVLQGANKGPGDPMENIKIMLLDMNDNPITLDITDANGSYGFSNLAYGDYKVWIDIPGKTTTPAQVTINATNPSASNVNIIINSTTIVAGIKDSKSIFDTNVGEVYPNPSFENSKIEVNLSEATQLKISIFNTVGQLVRNNTLELTSGRSIINIPGSELDNGIYTIRIESNIGQVYRKFVKVTK